MLDVSQRQTGPSIQPKGKFLQRLQDKARELQWDGVRLAAEMGRLAGRKCSPRNAQRLLKGEAGQRWAYWAAKAMGVDLPTVELTHEDDMWWLERTRRLHDAATPEEYKKTRADFAELLEDIESIAASRTRMLSRRPLRDISHGPRKP